MDKIKNIAAFAFLAFLISFMSDRLNSSFLFKFIHDNIISILINLLAINTATSGIVLAKLKEISLSHNGFDFSKSYDELRVALFEQIILIALAFVILVFMDSTFVKEWFGEYYGIGFNTLGSLILIYALDILRDTGKAIFGIIK